MFTIKHKIATAAVCLAGVAALALAVSAPADAAAGGDRAFDPPVTSDATWRALAAKARTQGRVAVIVALAVPTKRSHLLSRGEEAAQRSRIKSTRGALLDDLNGKRLQSLKTSNEMPLVAFHANAHDIAKLKRSKKVAAVTEDHEIALDASPHSSGDSGRPGTPQEATPLAPSPSGGPTGTSRNGSSSQLPYWWDYRRIGVGKARSNGYTGAGQTVAVLDTGVDRTHGWLRDRVVNEACFATRTVGYSGGDCPNGTSRQYGLGAAAECRYSYTCAHGTHVAHTAAGTWGVASRAGIIAVQVFHNVNNAPKYYDSDLVWALSHVYSLRSTYRIAAVNMSLGWSGSTGYCDNAGGDGSVNATYLTSWINALRAVGIASVISSGNDNYSNGVSHPACISRAISVGNTTLTARGYDAVYGRVRGGSNSSWTLDLLAPGTDICSAVPTWLDNDGRPDGIACGYIGTSMAAPHVAGAIAVLKQYRPGASVYRLQKALKLSGPRVYDGRNGITRTRINVWRALFKM